MRPNPRLLLPLFLAAVAAAAHAAALPADTTDELSAASRQLDEAALLRNVATDRAEAQHLLAARDLLREAEPSLTYPMREQAQRLEFDIARDAGGDAVDTGLSGLIPPPTGADLDRADLDGLAQRAQALVREAQTG